MWCNISGGAGGKIWLWSLSGVKGLSIQAKYWAKNDTSSQFWELVFTFAQNWVSILTDTWDGICAKFLWKLLGFLRNCGDHSYSTRCICRKINYGQGKRSMRNFHLESYRITWLWRERWPTEVTSNTYFCGALRSTTIADWHAITERSMSGEGKTSSNREGFFYLPGA